MNTADGRLISEYVALANRIDGLAREVVHFIEEARRIEAAALGGHLCLILPVSNIIIQ